MTTELTLVQAVEDTQIASMACNYNIIEFVNGQQDCRDGVTHMDGKGESYDAGYSTQYNLEQLKSTGVN